MKQVGEKTTGLLVGDLRRRVLEIREQLRQPGDYMFKPIKPSPLPWRLSREAFEEVDRRIVCMVFPRNTERVTTKDGRSFLRSASATNKTKKKTHLRSVFLIIRLGEGFDYVRLPNGRYTTSYPDRRSSDIRLRAFRPIH